MGGEVSTEKPKRGGKRAGAGRKKSGRRIYDSPHRARPLLSSEHPVHVVMRVQKTFLRLRVGRSYQAIRRALVRYLGRSDFRVVHVSIQHNHLHFLVEAADKQALTRGMQSLAINTARAINKSLGREGKVFAYRYQATQVTTPRQARNALAYVLNNWRRHREDLQTAVTRDASLDPYASGVSFRGWASTPRFALPKDYEPLPVSPPTTRLLKSSWKRYGPIDLFERPGPLW